MKTKPDRQTKAAEAQSRLKSHLAELLGHATTATQSLRDRHRALCTALESELPASKYRPTPMLPFDSTGTFPPVPATIEPEKASDIYRPAIAEFVAILTRFRTLTENAENQLETALDGLDAANSPADQLAELTEEREALDRRIAELQQPAIA